MSLIKSIKNQFGLSATPANNFTLDASADNGTMKLARGNAGATTQDIMTVSADGKVAFPAGVLSGLSFASVPSGGVTVPSPITAPKRITFNVTLLSNTGTGIPVLRLGTATGVANTGYTSCYANMTHGAQGFVGNDTTGFSVATNLATQHLQGVFQLEEIDAASNTWACTFQGTSSTTTMSWQFGTVSLPGPVTQVALVPLSGAFDSGNYSIRWEK